ncbi:MAG TPA: nucleotidyltransferase domain-containing protein, partial [Anaerolineae bacterium]|nr:nucleotidyltransferase domain-containing protein [Anaerolineae bacterium]
MKVRESVHRRGRGTHVRGHSTGAELVRRLRAQLPALVERYGVKSLGVFGSYLRGEQKAHSDFDVLVEFKTHGFVDILRIRMSTDENRTQSQTIEIERHAQQQSLQAL